jgi:dolichyl-phosphate beta-glucosyltransferase
LRTRGKSFEIVVVDDGSFDGTASLVGEFSADNREVRLISYEQNRGKGFAVRTGVLSATGDVVLVNDADGSSPIEELERLERAINSGADIAFGSRNMQQPDAKTETRFDRKHIGNLFNLIVQFLLLPGIRDTQCGFKLFGRHAAQDLFKRSTQDGFAFDVEILLLARLRHYKVTEVPINWHNVDGSKVSVFHDGLKMLLQVLRIAIALRFSPYERLASSSIAPSSANAERQQSLSSR